jgi:hypothetical protein
MDEGAVPSLHAASQPNLQQDVHALMHIPLQSRTNSRQQVSPQQMRNLSSTPTLLPQFAITLARNNADDKVSVDVDYGNGKTLKVRKVKTGLLSAWNESFPALLVEVGDSFVQINAKRDDSKALLKELLTAASLHIIVRKAPHRMSEASSQLVCGNVLQTEHSQKPRNMATFADDGISMPASSSSSRSAAACETQRPLVSEGEVRDAISPSALPSLLHPRCPHDAASANSSLSSSSSSAWQVQNSPATSVSCPPAAAMTTTSPAQLMIRSAPSTSLATELSEGDSFSRIAILKGILKDFGAEPPGLLQPDRERFKVLNATSCWQGIAHVALSFCKPALADACPASPTQHLAADLLLDESLISKSPQSENLQPEPEPEAGGHHRESPRRKAKQLPKNERNSSRVEI